MKFAIPVVLFSGYCLFLVEQPRLRPMEVWPIDEATSEPALVTVRTAILTALRRRDLDELLAFAAEDITWPGAGDQTPEERKANAREVFRAILNGDSKTFHFLSAALSTGGTFTTTRGSRKGKGTREFCAPYYYSGFPTDPPPPPGNPPDIDAAQFDSVLIAKDVPLRSKPGAQAAVIGRANYSLVRVETVEGDRDAAGVLWHHVTLTDGTFGFVPHNVVASPFDFYVCFGQRPEGWRITDFGEDRDPNEP